MVALPRPRLLLLHEAMAFVVERCDCDPAEARAALLRACREGIIPARGRATVSWPGRPEGMPPDFCVADIHADDWHMEVDWEHDSLGGYRSVTVERCNVEQWLSDQPAHSEAPDFSAAPSAPTLPAPAPMKCAPDACTRRTILEVYGHAQRHGMKPPNLKEIARPVQEILRREGYHAFAKRVETIAGEPSLSGWRRKSGKRVNGTLRAFSLEGWKKAGVEG